MQDTVKLLVQSTGKFLSVIRHLITKTSYRKIAMIRSFISIKKIHLKRKKGRLPNSSFTFSLPICLITF